MSFGPPRLFVKPKRNIGIQNSCEKVKNKITNLKNGGKLTEEKKLLCSTLNSLASGSDQTFVTLDISEIPNACKPKSSKKAKDASDGVKVVKKASNISSEEKQDIIYAQLIRLMYTLEIQIESQAAMKDNYQTRIAALNLKANEAQLQAISSTEWVRDVYSVCQEILLLGEKEKQFIELFVEAKMLEDLLSDLSSGVRNKFSQLHLNHVEMNTNSYDSFLNGLIQMSNMLQSIIENVNENSPYFGHLDTVKDVEQLLSKVLQYFDECQELMLSAHDKVLEVMFQKTLIIK